MDLLKLLKQYDYKLPEKLIAQKPAVPRDAARLLVYRKKTGKISFDTFHNIGKYLPKNSVLVFNQTKVVPARLKVTKPSGGKSELLYIERSEGLIKVLSNRKLPIGETITIISSSIKKLGFKVSRKQGQFYFLKPNFPVTEINAILEQYGETPLPPYIKNSPLTEKQKRREYQSVFAKEGLSVAAPTASLHFTKDLGATLKKQGIEIKFVTLNVNLGTFAALKEENLTTNKLHTESYEIEPQTAAFLNQAKKSGRSIIAVGTTVIRTLESAAQKDNLKNLSGNTQLFIRPGFKFQFIDAVITNFHVPKSSLMMLISAIIGRKKLLLAYKKAIAKKLRFFSFGDGMLILP